MTCHNRRDITLQCLERLYSQKLPDGVSFNVFLVDDGCSDGTGEAVKADHPDIEVIQGDGSLFWCNGMRLAWEHAAREDPDFYLWLNDDSMFLDCAISSLISTWNQAEEKGRPDTIVVGSCLDPKTGTHSYGGKRRVSKHPGKLEAILSGEFPAECDTYEGNVVLIPKAVYLRVGNMRPFSHAMGDTDYGYRATKIGCSILIAPGYLAECEPNRAEDFRYNKSLNFAMRIKAIIKRLPPRDWWFFLKEHSGLRVYIYFLRPYIRVLLGR